MKKSTIVFIELGMAFCIVFAAVALPDRTPPRPFLAVSSEFLLIGNYLVFRKFEDSKAKVDSTKKRTWTFLFRVFAIINFPWVVSQLLGSGR
jgi:hypothetical protein